MGKHILLAAIVAVAILAGAITYADADTAIVYGTGSGSSKSAGSAVTVSATINPKLTLTVTTPSASQTVDFGGVEPGTSYGPQTVSLSVQSNKTYNVTKSVTGAAAIGLSTTLGASSNNARTAGQGFTDDYSLNVPWTTDPGNYTATVQYTVIQN